jgi:AraC-like DNA-binding protein
MKLILQRLVQDPDKSFIFFYEKEPFFSSPWHYHPEFELLLILKSSGRCTIGDHTEDFREGDLFFMGKELPHVFDNDPIYRKGKEGLQAEGIVIQFLPDLLGKDFLGAPEFKAFLRVLENSARGLKMSGIAKELISDKMRRMLNMNSLQRLTMLLSIFDILSKTTEYRLLASPDYVHSFESSSLERFRKITNYIMKNFTDEISLSAIAEVANITPTNFCTYFKQFYRQTFVEYLNNIRVGYACKLFGRYEKNISEIAFESGFKNISNFNRQFKKYKGLSPAKYRQSLFGTYHKEHHLN